MPLLLEDEDEEEEEELLLKDCARHSSALEDLFDYFLSFFFVTCLVSLGALVLGSFSLFIIGFSAPFILVF